MFSSVRALPSPASAEDCCPSLFGWFTGLRHSPTSPVRSCPPCGLWPSRTGLGQLTKTCRRSPGSRACCFSACAGSKTTQDRAIHSRLAWLLCCLPPLGTESASCSIGFSKLNNPVHRYLCLRFKRYLAISPARLEARMDSLFSFPVGLFHPLQHAGLARRSSSGRAPLLAPSPLRTGLEGFPSSGSSTQKRPLEKRGRGLIQNE
jgi:hypothetical protein